MNKSKYSQPETHERVPLFKGLRGTLFSYFLLLAIVPMSTVIFISHQSAYNTLLGDAEKALISFATERTREIDTYFKQMLIALTLQSEMRENLIFISNLTRALSESGQTVPGFTKSHQWIQMTEKYGWNLEKHRTTYGYHDILLIDNKGNILFSVARENDIGTNLFHGIYSKTALGAASRQALETGQPVFSDYDSYKPSGENEVSGFIVSSIHDDNAETIGAIGFQFSIAAIDKIMQTRANLGNSCETYLIGPDLKMRSNSIFNNSNTVLKKLIRTEQSLLWKKQVDQGLEIKEMEHSAFIYDGPHGNQVLGVHSDIDIQGVRFGVIAEIETKEAFAAMNLFRDIMVALLCITALLVFFVALMLSKRIVLPIQILAFGAEKVSKGNYTQIIGNRSQNEIGRLVDIFNSMVASLRNAREQNELQNWYKSGETQFNERIRGQEDLPQLCKNSISFIAEYVNAYIAALYLTDRQNALKLKGSYAYVQRKGVSNTFEPGQGLVGQAALEKEPIIISGIPNDYIEVQSGLGNSPPVSIIVLPFMKDDQVMGVMELGSFYEFTDKEMTFLKLVSKNLAIAVATLKARIMEQKLLKQSQAHQKNLQVSNRQLEEQTLVLKQSEEKLKAQQEELARKNEELQTQEEELRQTNEELEEQTRLLEEEKQNVQSKNIELKKTKKSVELKAKDVETASRYKSEFLANMSHELRTPLNSILLLSSLLSNKKENNLTLKQIEYATTINSSGSELLKLINEILDLSKVESGKMECNFNHTDLQEITLSMERSFKAVAHDKGVTFTIHISPDLPKRIYTDRQRVEQILKNLLSNAFKFTEKGKVTLKLFRPDLTTNLSKSGITHHHAIAFSVSDTGIGIPKDKQGAIFEAFKQADGTTSRKFGGTGLGLSISRELAICLGGEIQLEPHEREGTIFTLYLPETTSNMHDNSATPSDSGIPERADDNAMGNKIDTFQKIIAPPKKTSSVQGEDGNGRQPFGEYIPDDRKKITRDSRSILIIEDDPVFASILCDMSREKEFKVIAAEDGETGLHFADYYQPSGIVLDIDLPKIDGWSVMTRLKENLKTRHIPVHFISASDKNMDAMKMGAVGYLTKPVSMDRLDQAFNKIDHIISKPVKNLLVVADDEAQQNTLAEFLGDQDVKITCVGNGKEARQALETGRYDCIILDIDLPDMSDGEFLSNIRDNGHAFPVPVIIYTGKELTDHEKKVLNRFSDSMVIKGAKNSEKLFDEVSLFLHRVESDLPLEKREILRMIHDKESILKGKTILLVDDDMRNVFALSSILEEKGIKVLMAKNGKEGVATLASNPRTDLVLMDIMMPVMDGYEAMQAIRGVAQFKQLPIIALTAKAMKGDRAKCIEAGASDYLSKPVNPDKLLSILRVWLY